MTLAIASSIASNIGKATDTNMLINNVSSGKTTALKAKAAAKGADMAKIDATSQEFEAQFISSMMQNMWSGMDTNGPLGGGDAEGTYRSMLIDQYGQMMTKAGGIGVAAYVKSEMLRMQEV